MSAAQANPGGHRAFLDQGRADGEALDIPIHHRNAAQIRSHFDGVTCVVPDAPRPDENLFALALTTGSRPHASVGGLRPGDIAEWDG